MAAPFAQRTFPPGPGAPVVPPRNLLLGVQPDRLALPLQPQGMMKCHLRQKSMQAIKLTERRRLESEQY